MTATVDTTAPSETISATIGTNTGSTTTITSGGLTHDNTLALSGTVSDTNGVSSVHVFDGATDLGAATIVAGNWSLTTSALSNGTHSFTAVATDNAGNTTTTAAVTATVDTTATVMATVIESFGSTSLTEIANYYYLYNSSGSGPSLKYLGADFVAYNAWAPIGAEQTASGYEVAWKYAGADLYTVWNTDSSGNFVSDTIGAVSGASSVLKSLETSFQQDLNGDGRIGVDMTAPVAPSIASFSTDSGVVGDNITNDSTLTLTGAAEANSTVKVYDGATLLGSTAANGSGAWSYTTAALGNGAHSLTATATDAAGNTGVASTALAVTVDTTAPSETISATIGTDTGSTTTISSGGLTNDNTLALSGTVSDTNGVSSVHVFDGATDLGAATIVAGNWSLTTSALSNGTHSFTAVATDKAGNTTTTAAVAATVDTTATVIESFGSTSLTEIANHYYLYNSSGSGPSLKYLGADFVAYNAWAPIGAEQTASGYEVAWKYAGADLYTVWNTDSSGNFVSDTIGAVSGASSVLKSIETSFQQDLNGDGVIGVPISSASTQTLSSLTAATINTDGASSVADATVDTPVAVTTSSFTFVSKGFGLLAGSTEPNSAISIDDDNSGKHLGQTTADSFGTWSVLMNKLSNTVHSVTATASDQAGDTGSVHAIIGTAGNDTITNGAANEVLFGNGGADAFAFSGNIGKATIADFQATNDVVQLNHNVFASVADVFAHAAQVGSDVTITFDATNSVTLHDTMLAHLTAANFHLV